MSKDNKNQMQRRLNNEIIKRIKLFDYISCFDFFLFYKNKSEENEGGKYCPHKKELGEGWGALRRS